MKEHLLGSFYNNNKNMQCLETKQTQANRKEQIEFRVIFQTHQSMKLILNCIKQVC